MNDKGNTRSGECVKVCYWCCCVVGGGGGSESSLVSSSVLCCVVLCCVRLGCGKCFDECVSVLVSVLLIVLCLSVKECVGSVSVVVWWVLQCWV